MKRQSPSILLATNKRDITTDFVVLELRRRNIPFLRLNTEDLPQNAVTFEPTAVDGWQLTRDDQTHRLSSFSAGYYRRPSTPIPAAAITDPVAQEYCVSEWSAVLRSLWNALDGRWLNSPFAILRAEDKPKQLAVAASLGFHIPETIVTNDQQAAIRFADRHSIIGKPLRQALLERGETGEVIFTSRLSRADLEEGAAVSLAPCILQREVTKKCDVRVTIVGQNVFAVAIGSQATADTATDWRKGSNPDLSHEVIYLPADIVERCVALTQLLDISFGAIDLVLDKADNYWFLEINPNGQWAWIERRTGLPITAAIVDALLEIEH
jgi:glutathione synthase/RimK-type ligase-like ATP-grasp enzyme